MVPHKSVTHLPQSLCPFGHADASPCPSHPPREALVIGNSDYSFGPLRNKLNWKVGDSEYEGDGTLDGNLVTVKWGSSTPVVYALADDGSLKGLWAGGHGEERLTPEQ